MRERIFRRFYINLKYGQTIGIKKEKKKNKSGILEVLSYIVK